MTYVTGSERGDLQLTRDEALKEAQETTRLLCKVCRYAKRQDFALHAEVWRWYEKHAEKDK